MRHEIASFCVAGLHHSLHHLPARPHARLGRSDAGVGPPIPGRRAVPDQDRRDAARKGGEAKAQARLDAMRTVAAAMPPLNSPENCKLRLERIQDMVIGGVLSGAEAGAAVRASEVWLKSDAAADDRKRMRDLERQVADLEAQLAKAGRGAGHA